MMTACPYCGAPAGIALGQIECENCGLGYGSRKIGHADGGCRQRPFCHNRVPASIGAAVAGRGRALRAHGAQGQSVLP